MSTVKETTNCGLSPEAHIATLLRTMKENGLGTRCEGTFQALAEMVDFLRRIHGHDYQVKGYITEENLRDLFTKGIKEADNVQQQIFEQITSQLPKETKVH